MIHEKDFFGGPYVPEFIFHKYGPLKLATWSSLFLECSCIFLVWSKNKYIKYGTVYSMIALHIGIELTMNMHVFEILSIIGWCMFLIQSELPYQKYCARTKVDTIKRKPSHKSMFQYLLGIIQHPVVINIFLLTLTTIFIADTFPLHEIHDILDAMLTVPLSVIKTTTTSPSKLSFISGLSYIVTNIQTTLLYLNTLRQNYLFPYVMKYLYPVGLYQAVWNLYSGAPDTNCIFTTNITTYSILQNGSHQMNSYAYRSPDWGTMTWYTKKRYQRPMTMQEKLENSVCRDCYVRYHANNIINDELSHEGTNTTNIQLASATLTGQCENPPFPPVDDWFNWSGWFYADAKQSELVQHDPVLLYTTNICNDLNAELCRRYYNEGYCHTAQYNHAHRHSFNNGTILVDNDSFVFNITQTCRKSCNFCPEDGYDTNEIVNGTRLSIFWPVPTWDNAEQVHYYAETSMYYDCTVIQVRDRPLKLYLVKYDDSAYSNEWFDPMTLRDRGYHFLPDDEYDDLGQSISMQDYTGSDLMDEAANDAFTSDSTDDDDVADVHSDEEVSMNGDDDFPKDEHNNDQDEL